MESRLGRGTASGLPRKIFDEPCYVLCLVPAQWRGWTFLAPIIHVLCEWCHSFSWPLLVSLINTRIRLVREWVISWRYFWSKFTPLLITKYWSVRVYQRMLPSIGLVITMVVICGSLLLSYFQATDFHRKYEGNLCTPHLGESLIKRWSEQVYKTLISGTSL